MEMVIWLKELLHCLPCVRTLGWNMRSSKQAIASWRRAMKVARDENLVTAKAEVMLQSTEILGEACIRELHEQQMV